MRLNTMTGLSVVIGAIFSGLASAACDPGLSSNRPADTYARDQIKHYGSAVAVELYFVPLPRTCPRTPAGYVRWDLCR